MRGPSTLRGRIALVALAVTAGWVAVLTVGFNVALGAQLQQQADSVLRTRAETVASTVEVSTDGRVAVREIRNDVASDVGIWVFAGTDVLEAPTGGNTLQDEAMALAGRGEQVVTTVSAAPVRLLALPVMSSGQQVATVVSTLALAPYRQTEELAVVGSVLLAALVMVGMYLVVRVSTARALQPVQQMTEQAGRWSADEVDRRFPLSARPAELEQLATTLNGVLDRLSAVLRHEKAFSAQISHELRTPLAAIVAETSLLRSRARSPAELDAALQQIATGAERMTHILDTLMSTARSDSGTVQGRCDAHEVLEGLSQQWTEKVALVVEASGSSHVGVDGRVLERILAPVLDNAARYARSTVTVTTRSTGRTVQVVVHDDGPGVSDEDAEHLFEPGWRATHHDGHDGAGLGLALVQRLATATGGSVSKVPGPEGATFVVSLPRG